MDLFSLRRQRAMSLLELLAAMGILSVALLALVRTQLFLLQSHTYSEARLRAVQACQSLLDEARFEVRRDFTYSGPAGWTNSPQPGLDSLSYRLDWSTLPSPPDFRQLVVTVRWQDKHGQHQYSLTSGAYRR